jgi:xylan 1,4-beta-xylosidase
LTSTGTYKKPENFRLFLEHVTDGINYATGEKGSPVDFISIHAYGGSSAEGGPGRQYPETDYLMEQLNLYADMRDEYPQLRDVPIHVEEWGESSGGTTGVKNKPMADIRNSQYGAAFLANLVTCQIRNRQENDRKIECFTFCASGYEIIPEYDFMGYRTLDTKSGFYKPILNAYRLLKKLDKELIQTDITPNKNILSCATRTENRICVLITNYQHEHPFNDGMAERISLEIKRHWGETSNVTVKHYRIDEHHSNAYSAFKRLGSLELIDPITVDAIKKRMNLELMEEPLRLKKKDKAELQFFLPCNAVSLIEVIKEEQECERK